MNKEEAEIAAQQVSKVLRAWLRDLKQVLQLVDNVLSQCHSMQDVPTELRGTVHLLRPMIRQCRAQVPTDEMVGTWLRVVVEKERL